MRKSIRQAQDTDVEEIEEEEVELSEKEQKKKKQKEGAEKRKNAKKKDKVARWGGLILLGLVMFVGFLLWVSGEMKSEKSLQPTNINNPVYEKQFNASPTGNSTIIVR